MDNGAPFASVGLGGLSRLSIWLIKLGIRPERIESGHPEQNGRHERMLKISDVEKALDLILHIEKLKDITELTDIVTNLND